MSDDLISQLVLLLQQYPLAALLFVFLVALSESLILVGLVVPGAVLMLAFGALIALDALSFWSTTLSAVLGAIAGDSISYWLGKKYKLKLLTLWPLSKHPQLIQRASDFFQRHGMKSLFLARFIGLLRPVIPAMAGIGEMPLRFFLLANISSALLWAPLYLLPGILFGLSFELASEFAGKFVFLVVLVVAVIVAVLWLLQRLYLLSQPWNEKLIRWLLDWGRKHRLAGEVPAAIFDQQHPELRGLLIVALLLFVLSALFSITVSYLPFDTDSFNQFIYYSLHHFRSPPLDGFMYWLLALSDARFIALLYLLIGGLLLWRQNLFTLWHWLAAVALPLLLAPFFSNPLTAALQQYHAEVLQVLPFMVVVAAIGFLTIVINAGLSFAQQKIVYYIAATLVLLLLLAQLYFAHAVLTTILLQLFVALLWFNLLGIAWHRHKRHLNQKKCRRWIAIALLMMLIFPFTQLAHTPTNITETQKQYVMGKNIWLEQGWQLLPVTRRGLYQHYTRFNLQWAGHETAIRSLLQQAGFREHKNSLKLFSHWFALKQPAEQLPVLPHIHNGKYESLRFVRTTDNNNEIQVIRLWPSDYELRENNISQPLWFGSFSHMAVRERLGIRYLYTKEQGDESLPPVGIQTEQRLYKNQPIYLLH